MALPLRNLGSTGEKVTALGLGGVRWSGSETDAEAIEVVHRAIDLGITYFDTASSYGESERRLGLALNERDRNQLFLATKCIERSGDEVKREIAQSFERLGVDVIDLIQLHELDREQTLDRVLGADGALRVIEEYRESGKIRFVGLTGHTHPAQFPLHIAAHGFDTVLNPLGVVNRVWNDFSETIPAARERGTGIIAMKVMAYDQGPTQRRAQFVHYSMGLDIDVAVIGMDTVAQVEENVRIAESFRPLSAQEEQEVVDIGLEMAAAGNKALFWLPEQRRAS